MPSTLFAKKIFTGRTVLDNQVITIDGARILTIGPGTPENTDQSLNYLAPGFADIHINGGSRLHFTRTPTAETIGDIASSSAALGTAYTLPTLITSPLDNILTGIEAVREYRKQYPDRGVLGMHLEGPFLHPSKRGAHLTAYLQNPTDEVLKEIVRHGAGVIKMITIAPELFTRSQIALLMEAGIVVSAGHSNATFEEAQDAFEQGIRLVTHLFNAMSAFGHRNPGLVGATFNNDQVYAPIILDGAHCHFGAARTAYAAKKEKLFLISDALFTGDEMKTFTWGDFDARMVDGKYMNSEGNLAGAAICMGDAVRNAVKEVGIGLQEAVDMSTIRPAKALCMDHEIGLIAPGYPAVFTAFDDSLQHFEVVRYNS